MHEPQRWWYNAPIPGVVVVVVVKAKYVVFERSLPNQDECVFVRVASVASRQRRDADEPLLSGGDTSFLASCRRNTGGVAECPRQRCVFLSEMHLVLSSHSLLIA